MKQRMWKRLVAGILCCCLLVTGLPLQALAAVQATKENTTQQNEELLQQLEALTEDDSDAAAALAAMREMGLVDEEGNLLQTETVTLDGEQMTLDQVAEYLETCGEDDLQKLVDIDGTQVTLENLRTMMEIEAELDRIRETYFSEEAPEMTEEQQAALQSLANQLATQGIVLYNDAALDFPSGVNQTARVSMSLSGSTVSNAAGTVTATFSLTGAKAGQTVSFTVRTLDGSAKAGTNYTAVNQTVTLTANANGSASQQVSVTINAESNTWANDNLWSGDKVFYIQATNISGALFTSDKHSLTQMVRVQDTSIAAGDFLTSVSARVWNDLDSTVDQWVYVEAVAPSPTVKTFTDEQKYFLGHSASSVKLSWENFGIKFNSNADPVDFSSISKVYENFSFGNDRGKAITEWYLAIGLDGVSKVSKHIGYDLKGKNLPDASNDGDWENKIKSYSLLQGSKNEDALAGEITWILPASWEERKPIAAKIADGKLQVQNWAIVYPIYYSNWKDRYYSYSHILNITSTSVYVNFSDNAAPAIDSVQVVRPSGNAAYTAGDQIPVAVTFDGPVKVAGNEKMTINDVSCPVQESGGTISKTLTFLYTVKEVEGNDLKLGNLTTITDVSDNSAAITYTGTVSNVIDGNPPHWAALEGVTTNAGTDGYAPGVTTGTITVTLDANEKLRNWVTSSTDLNDVWDKNNAYVRVKSLGASIDGGKTIIDLYVDGQTQEATELIGDFTFPISVGGDTTHVIELYELNPTTAQPLDKSQPFFGVYTAFTAKQAVFLGENDVTLTYPAEWPRDEVNKDEPELDADDLQTEDNRVYVYNLTDPDNFGLGFNVANETNFTWADTSNVGYYRNETLYNAQGEQVEEGENTLDFAWSSSNDNVALIDASGNIEILTTGQVSFTLTAFNGNVVNSEAEGETYACVYETPALLVGVGDEPFLTVPESLRTTTVQGGHPATILWSSNLTEKNRDQAALAEEPPADLDQVETIFSVALYKSTQWDTVNNEPNADQVPVYETEVPSTMDAVKSSVTIPAANIPYDSNVEIGDPSYYVEISSPRPGVEGEYLSTYAQIVVQSPPAKITLNRPASLYITDDTSSLALSWELDNFNAGSGEFRLAITNNSVENATPVENTEAATGLAGTYSMEITPVTNRYRDIYTVEVAAKNATDSTWSYDSFVLYVYDTDVLQHIYVDGKPASSVTMNNESKDYIQAANGEEGGPNEEEQKAVWENRQDIALTEDISMDPTKPWLEVPDQFAWSAQNTDGEGEDGGTTHATINYQQGALYEDITRYSRTSYGPLSEFRLSGLSDGTTTVTATHVSTGTAAELAVEVKTLKDKLYLFQFNPAIQTTLRYTNGEGKPREVTSMTDGRAAVYEPSGIASDVYLSATDEGVEYFGTIYNDQLVSSEQDSTQLELYPVNTMTLRKAAQVPIFLKKPDGTPYTGKITVHGGVYLNDEYAQKALIDTGIGSGFNGVDGKENIQMEADGSYTFTFDMTQFSTENRNVIVNEGGTPVNPEDNVQFVLQIEAEDYYPILVRVNSSVNEEDAIAAGDRIITLKNADELEDEEVRPFAAVQTLFYSGNKYGYSIDVLDRKGKLGPGETYPDLELETITLWWGMDKSEDVSSQMNMTFEDQYGRTPKNQTSKVMDYPFTTMPVTVNSWKLDESTMTGWLDPLQSTGLTMVYTNQGSQIKREDPGFRVINMIGAPDAADSDNLVSLMKETAGAATNESAGVKVANALVTTGIALATSFNIGTSMDMLTMKIVPTADPTVFRGIFLMGLNNMIGDNVSGIDADTSRKGDLDYMPGYTDLKNVSSMGLQGWAQDSKNRIENAKKLLQHGASTKNNDKDISYMLKGGFETEIYFDYNDNQWKMVVVTGQLNVGGGFGKHWNFNSFCGPVPVTAQLAFGVALNVQFAAAVDRTKMMNDYLTQVQLNAFVRAFGGIGFDYAIVALKVGLFGQLSFDGAIRFLNAAGTNQAKVGYDIHFDGEVGIEFLVKFLFISYERILWSQKIEIASGQNNAWNEIGTYWEKVQAGNSGNEYGFITPEEGQNSLAVNSTQQAELLAADTSSGTALYGSPSTATLESRDYLENPRTYGGSTLGVLRARAQTLAANGSTNGLLMGNSYTGAEPVLTEDGQILAFVHDWDSTELEDTKASYVVAGENGGFTLGQEGFVDEPNDGNYIEQFPEPAQENTQAEGILAQANVESASGGDSQLRIAGTKADAIAVWTRVTETLEKEPGSQVTTDDQMLMMNSTEIFASVKVSGNSENDGWVTTRLTTNGSADMSPVAATNGKKAIVAWRAVAANDSTKITTFNSYDTILYKIYDYATKTWSEAFTLYNGTSGAVKGIEAQMTENGAIAVVYTIEKGSTDSTTQVTTLADGTTEITSNLQTIFAIIEEAEEGEIPEEEDPQEPSENSEETAEPAVSYVVTKNVQVTNDDYVNENPQITAVKFPNTTATGYEKEESFVLAWHSVQSADGVEKNDIRLVAFREDGTLRDDFVDSLSSISSNTGASITSNFRFVKGADTLEDLSILWSEPSLEVKETDETAAAQDEEETSEPVAVDTDVLKGVRFRMNGSAVSLTAPVELAKANGTQIGTSTTIDSFDAFLLNDSIQAVMLSTEYGVTIVGQTYHIEEVPGVLDNGQPSGESTEIAIQNSQTNLMVGTGAYSDTFSAEVPVPDYNALAVDATIPVQTTVTNLGTQPITSITFTVGGNEEHAGKLENLSLQPGDSTEITAYYTVKKAEGSNALVCPRYTVSATFHSGNSYTLGEDTQVINLNVHDLEITTFETVAQENGGRVMQFTLYNGSAAKLENNSNRSVKVALFSGPECTKEQAIDSQYVEFEKLSTGTTATREGDNSFTISNTADLSLIDQGGYSGQVTFHLKDYAEAMDKDNTAAGDNDEGSFLQNGEIRENGITVYLKAWIVDETGHELGEIYTDNNVEFLTHNSLIQQNEGQQVTISSDIRYNETGTTVTPTVQNNSLQPISNGYLLVDLLDSSGRVLETKTASLSATLSPEQRQTLSPVSFNQQGVGVAYRFGVSQAESSTALSEIALSQIALEMDNYTTEVEEGEEGEESTSTTVYKVTADASLSETTLTLLAAYAGATITVNDKEYDLEDPDSRLVTLPVGTTVLEIQVTAGNETRLYRVEITRPATPSGGTGGGAVSGHPIVVDGETDHGKVSVSPSKASAGQTVTITATPDEGFEVGSVTVTKEDGGRVTVTAKGDGVYTFIMPNTGVTVDVVFLPKDWPFTDVSGTDWFLKAVAYVYEHGIMAGTGDTTFQPGLELTRAMAVQILYNLEGKPAVTGTAGFTDLKAGAWYENAVNWGAQNQVVAGMGDGTFAPDISVTREQFAQMLYNYAQYKKYDLTKTGDLSQFTDAGSISSWAETAMNWANGNGLINGHEDTGKIDPQGTATRAQAASILMNFDKNLVE